MGARVYGIGFMKGGKMTILYGLVGPTDSKFGRQLSVSNHIII